MFIPRSADMSLAFILSYTYTKKYRSRRAYNTRACLRTSNSHREKSSCASPAILSPVGGREQKITASSRLLAYIIRARFRSAPKLATPCALLITALSTNFLQISCAGAILEIFRTRKTRWRRTAAPRLARLRALRGRMYMYTCGSSRRINNGQSESARGEEKRARRGGSGRERGRERG